MVYLKQQKLGLGWAGPGRAGPGRVESSSGNSLESISPAHGILK